MTAQESLLSFQCCKNRESLSFIHRILVLRGRRSRANHAETVGLTRLQMSHKLGEVHVVIPVLMYDAGLLSVRLAEDKTVADSDRMFSGRTSRNRGKQWDRDVRPLN